MTTRDQVTFVGTTSGPPGCDQRLVLALPWKLHALLPDKVTFADADDWAVVQITIAGREMLRSTYAAKAFSDMVESGSIKFGTIQRRMEIEIIARPQKDHLVFRCEIEGVSFRSTSAADQFADDVK